MKQFKVTCAFCRWEETVHAPSRFNARLAAMKKHSEQESIKKRLLCIPDIKVEETE